MSWMLKLYPRMKGCCATAGMSRKEAILGAGLTLGSALVVAAMMLIGRNSVTEAIGVVMFCVDTPRRPRSC